MSKTPSKSHGTSPRSWATGVLVSCGVLLGSTTGCGSEPGPSPGSSRRSEVLGELAGLAFVPAGSWELLGYDRMERTSALFVDRYEVTRGRWQQWSGGHPELAAVADRWEEGGLDLPATFCTIDEAQAFAQLRGMRIPTVEEWMFIAVGQEGRRWPWGNVGRASATNDSMLALRRPLPVGTFESGASPEGIYDLVGNVWEWASGTLPRKKSPGGPGQDSTTTRVLPIESLISATVPGTEHQLMGGSYLWPAQPLWKGTPSFFARTKGGAYAARDAGFRCVVDAREYLQARAPSWSQAALRETLVEVGQRWGPGLRSLLIELIDAEDAPEALSWLLEGVNR